MGQGVENALAEYRAYQRAKELGYAHDMAEHAAERTRHWIRNMLIDSDTAVTWALRDAKALQDLKREEASHVDS